MWHTKPCQVSQTLCKDGTLTYGDISMHKMRWETLIPHWRNIRRIAWDPNRLSVNDFIIWPYHWWNIKYLLVGTMLYWSAGCAADSYSINCFIQHSEFWNCSRPWEENHNESAMNTYKYFIYTSHDLISRDWYRGHGKSLGHESGGACMSWSTGYSCTCICIL